MAIEQTNDETTFEVFKRNRGVAIVLGVITVAALLSLFYAFNQRSKVVVQTKRADSLQLLSDSLHVQVQQYQKIAEKNLQMAIKERQKAEAAKKHATAKPTPKSKKTKPKK